MIFGDLANWEKEKNAYASAIVRGLDYIRNTDFSLLENGAYKIEGQLMYASVQERDTKPKSLIKAENHQQYIDIQYLFCGEEVIGYASQSDANIVTDDLLEKHDAYLYEHLNNETDLILKEGNFAVFFPDDLHRPGCVLDQEMKIKKVVIKVHMSLLK